MTVLFGTAEYFERELLANIVRQEQGNFSESLTGVYASLKKELSNDFVCEEKIKMECLKNLKKAYLKLTREKLEVLACTI